MNPINNLLEIIESISENWKTTIENDTITIHIPTINQTIQINSLVASQLIEYKIPSNLKGFKYYEDYGFSLNNYGEFFLGSDEIFLYELYGEVSNIDLKFKLGEYLVEFSRASEISELLVEPFYSQKNESIADRGLNEYFYTLKIFNTPQEIQKDYLIKSLYYLNSHYLKPSGRPLMVYHIKDDHFDNRDDTIENLPEIRRARIRKRKDFISMEPLFLYSDAMNQKSESQFLGFYRVLEFFFNRALEKKVSILRYDNNMNEQSLINLIQQKNEKNGLYNLIDLISTKAEINSYLNYLHSNALIGSPTLKSFIEKLYDFRNSLVHSKETQSEKIHLPDIFGENNELTIWNSIVKQLATAVINRLNTK